MKSSIQFVLALAIITSWTAGCSSSQAIAPQNHVYQTPAAASFSQGQLDSLLAPIALYPDALLSQVLIASTYPLEIVEADRWVKSNGRLQGEDAVKAVESRSWDPSVKALVAFPDVLKRMSEDLDWTQQLGDAFLDDEGRVMDSIQNLRDKAYAAGNLNNTDHVKVVREDRVIMIEPAVERVVYVPVYDTRVVYGPWWWADYPPVYWNRYSTQVYFSSGFYWGPRVYIGSSFFFSSCRWSDRRVVVIDRHSDYYNHRHAYSSRHLAHYQGARPWSHNPVHRRGVAYYNEPVRARYNSNREPTRNAWDSRQQSRDRAGVVSLNPNRESRANRESNNVAPRQSSNRTSVNGAPQNQVYQSRSDAVQARLSSRQQTRTESTTPAANNQATDRRIRGSDGQSNQTSPQTTNRTSNQTSNRTTTNNSPREVYSPREVVRSEPSPQVTNTQQNDKSDNSPRQIIRQNDDSNNSRMDRTQRETRMESRREPRMESRRSGGSGDNGGGRRIIRQ